MGMLRIQTSGSFAPEDKTFCAITHGHAHAVAEAIRYLAEVVLPMAISNDHKCHSEGIKPEQGFDKK